MNESYGGIGEWLKGRIKKREPSIQGAAFSKTKDTVITVKKPGKQLSW
jgi:hypothetical protein